MAQEERTCASKWFTNIEYAALLLDVKARCNTEKQREFVDGLIIGFNSHASQTELKETQKDWLIKIRG